MPISALYHFPVKSLQGHSVQSLALDQFGAVNDRRWMLVDGEYQFLSQRRLRSMARLKATATHSCLTIENHRGEAISIAQPGDSAELRQVRVWRDTCTARDAGDTAARWLSEQLQIPVRLVAMGPEYRRPLAPPREQHQVSFADGAPLLLIGQASLDDLNARLPQPVSMLRFRPNLVVSGAAPYAEDQWRRVRIHTAQGPLDFDCTHPCARCAIPGLDPHTGEPGKEPLRTLARYRRGEDGLIYFGQNLAPAFRSAPAASINLGDRVEVE